AARAVEAAGSTGIAALFDGPSAVRADLVGLAFALPDGARFYLPLVHRYLGAPTCLREGEALGVLEPLLASPSVAKHAHDAKTVEVLLRRRGIGFRGVASDAMIASYLLDASRTRYDLDVIGAGLGVGEAGPRTSWLGTGRNARSGSEVPVE